MPAKTYTVGPGKLVFGAIGSTKEVSCQVSSCVVSWDVEQGDKTNLLCGETEFGASDYSATLKATLFQDLAEANSFVAWTWTNKTWAGMRRRSRLLTLNMRSKASLFWVTLRHE